MLGLEGIRNEIDNTNDFFEKRDLLMYLDIVKISRIALLATVIIFIVGTLKIW